MPYNEKIAYNEHTDPSQNFIANQHAPLDAIFHPKTVAVVGAKDNLGSVGRTIMMNLLSGAFGGKVFPVNPNRDKVLGQKAYPNILDIPEPVDLAIIVTPARTVTQVMRDCVQAKVKGAIVISAGFKELGPEGLAQEQELIRIARSGNIRVIGPNCLGVMNPIYGMNATFAKGMALPGNVAFISQSGAMCTAVLDWSFQEHIGFSSFVSIGSMADINWGDLISYLGNDPHTASILIYMESIGDARSFLSAAREIALEKPIIVIKAGRSEAAASAAASHTGSLAGSDDVFEAALQRVGVLRVNTIAELFRMASVLSRQPLPKGPRLAIVTNAGGPSVLATDAAVLNGAKMAVLEHKSLEELNSFLPEAWSHGNPVDLLGDADAERFGKTIEVLAEDQGIDGILTVLSPQDVTDPLATADCLRPYAQMGKPLLASWMGGATVSKGVEVLSQAKIPTFPYPDDAAWTFATMWRYKRNLDDLYQTPTLRDDFQETSEAVARRTQARRMIDQIRSEGRTLLSEAESKKLLALYDIPVVQTEIAFDEAFALESAKKMGYPVVLKLLSETITHKTDVGGVKLNLMSDEQVVEAFRSIRDSVTRLAGAEHFQGVTVQKMIKLEGYELIIGSTTDVQFGPVLLFGTGGQLVEVFKDRALALPPLNATLALRLIERTKIGEALEGVRGREPVDVNRLAKILVRFSQLIVENRLIAECDINPLLASPDGLVALDGRVVLQDPAVTLDSLPPLAIRPYPIEYIGSIKLKNGTPVVLKPIRPEDEPLIVAFHKELSELSVRQRYFSFVDLSERVAHERLIQICFNDYDRELAIVAEVKEEESQERKVIGIARLSRIRGTEDAQLRMIIADAYHNQGLGTQLIKHLIAIAKEEKIQAIHAHILEENGGMIHICKKLGFEEQPREVPYIVFLKLKVGAVV